MCVMVATMGSRGIPTQPLTFRGTPPGILGGLLEPLGRCCKEFSLSPHLIHERCACAVTPTRSRLHGIECLLSCSDSRYFPNSLCVSRRTPLPYSLPFICNAWRLYGQLHATRYIVHCALLLASLGKATTSFIWVHERNTTPTECWT